MRTLLQLMFKLLFALSALNRFHTKRLTRFIHSGQMLSNQDSSSRYRRSKFNAAWAARSLLRTRS
jgi:hypothetical protein